MILSGTGGVLTELARKTGIPVVTTLMGKGAVPDSLPQNLGMAGDARQLRRQYGSIRL
mgnify:CR=1 FL=1